MKRMPTRRAARAIGLGLLTLGLLACSPATRLTVLSFFFDGVPGGKPMPAGAAAARPSASSPFHPERAVATPRPTPPPIVSTHKPVVERKCGLCHETGAGYTPIALDERLCDRCHKAKRDKEGWNHGPINLGTCIPCHRAHESPYPHLLDQPLPELCLTCHPDTLTRQAPHHKVADIRSCTACHDPHRMF